MLSHRSAAAHWGLLTSAAAKIDVTAPASRVGLPGVRLHRSRSIDARDTTSHQGIPITSVARTLLDLAATVRADRLERALAQAEHLELYDHRAITELLARANGHRGQKALTEATALEPKLYQKRLGDPAPEARPRRSAAGARRQPSLRCPGSRRVQARLPLAGAPPHRRDRRLEDPPHESRLRKRSRQGRRPDRGGLPRRPLHLAHARRDDRASAARAASPARTRPRRGSPAR
jgi:hypothetical protein